MRWLMKPLAIAIGLMGSVVLSHRCAAQVPDDPFSDYLQRSVTINLGAGNAKDTNAAIHTIDPWPPYVGHTRIRGDGRRAVDSVERMYRTPDPFERQNGMPTGGEATGSGSNLGTVNVGSGPPTPVQPVSGGY
jgi:hypothetical protein